MQYFWTNTILYLILGAITVAELVYVLVRAKENRKKMFALFLSFSGLAYYIEGQILLVFKGYEYYPMIFDKISQSHDSVTGNLFSQFSIAATALLISSLNLKKYWYVIIALLYGGIEELFLFLGIYKQNWYATWMTIAGFPILLWLMNKIYSKAFKNPGRFFQYIITLLAVYVPFVHLFIWPFGLLGYPTFSETTFPDAALSSVFWTLINFTLLYNTFLFLIIKRLKWYWHAFAILSFYLVYYLLFIMRHIIYDSIWMLLLFATIQLIGIYLCILSIRKLYGFHKSENSLKKTAAPKPVQ